MLLEKGQKLLFIGDSVTDCERLKPDEKAYSEHWGMDMFPSLMDGYVLFILNWQFGSLTKE